MPPAFPSSGLPQLEAEIHVDASVEAVWSLLSDLRAMSSRSPETVRMFISDAPQVGTKGINVNRKGAVVWPTTTKVTRWKPPSDDGTAALAFWVGPTNVEWSYELSSVDGGTRVVERRSPLRRANLSVRLASKWFMGGAENHDVELVDGMRRTLAALKADAERR
ncbi:hypothetical protein ASD11_03470 [Aeromicrobium sp. Root495]|uniref:SRPBCC family protein n=1 Tax=Aeromicrobium sp. Root495 TaxID=1736550 RepID=UPI0006F679AB|nr:SRPBCC family protein [Aeromicrobium sp. Root495]KQY58719.1 hypothetical protein ASD11_03470 [Aeromicrobium sp. Root495]